VLAPVRLTLTGTAPGKSYKVLVLSRGLDRISLDKIYKVLNFFFSF